jgi:hypothetical protein
MRPFDRDFDLLMVPGINACGPLAQQMLSKRIMNFRLAATI